MLALHWTYQHVGWVERNQEKNSKYPTTIPAFDPDWNLRD